MGLDVKTNFQADVTAPISTSVALQNLRLEVPAYACGCDKTWQYIVRYTPSTFLPNPVAARAAHH